MSQMPPPPGGPPGGYPPGAYPGYQPRPQGSSVGLAVTSLVLGILSIPCFCFNLFALPIGIVAIILGILAKGKADRGEAGGRGMALAGIITGVIGFLLALSLWMVSMFAGPEIQNRLLKFQQKQMQQIQQQQQTAPASSPNATTVPSTEP